MAEWGASKWLLSLALYFIIYFLIVWATLSAKAVIYSADQNFNYTTPDWYEFREDYYKYGGICSKPTVLDWHQVPFTSTRQLPCGTFKDEYQCEAFQNCQWENISYIFIDVEKCAGVVENTSLKYDYNVNLSYYGYTTPFDDFSTNDSDLCLTHTNEITCKQFGCSWITDAEEYEKILYDTNPFNFWNTIKFMFGFDVSTSQFGFYSFLWALFFTYIPLIMLVIALRYTLPI